MAQVIEIPFSGQLIGQGYNSETGESIGTALEVDAVFEDSAADAQSAFTGFDLVATQDSLMKSLGISASLDGRIGLFSGGAKMSFAESNSVNSFSSYIAGRSFIQNAMRHGRGFRLTQRAREVLRQGEGAFKKAFGDRFVRALRTGGEFCVVARVTSISSVHQTKIAAALHGAYNGLVNEAEFKAELEAANLETHGGTEISVKMFQLGGIENELAFTGPDAAEIIHRLKDLPRFVHEHAAGIQVELASYDTIPIPVPTPEEIEDRIIVLNDCAAQKSSLLNALSDLNFALEPNAEIFFDNLPPRDENIRLQGLYRATLNALMAHAIKVSTGKMDPHPQLFIASPAPPALTFTKKPFSPAIATIQVQSLVGIEFSDLEFVEQAFAGVEPGRITMAELRFQLQSAGFPPGNDMGFNQELLDFLFSGVVFHNSPDPPDLFDNPETGVVIIASQFPASGTVAPGSQIVLRLVAD